MDEKKTIELKTEVERSGLVGDYFVAIEEILQGNPDGKALRHWIDSSALVLGKNLAKESLGSEQGKNVAEGIKEITDIEKEIAENHKVLRELAAAAGVDMETLLADGQDEIIQAIVTLREQKIARIAELHTALRAYALELIRTLQEGNRRKLGMDKDKLRVWQEKFAALESLPQDYRSFTARMEQDFVAAKRRSAEYMRLDKGLEQLKERSIAVSEKVWGDYAHHVVEVLDKEFPGAENEEKRRHLLAGLLRDGDQSLLFVHEYTGGAGIIIKDEIKYALPQGVMIDIAKRHAMALGLSRLKLYDRIDPDGNRDSWARNYSAYEQSVNLIASLDEPSLWSEASTGGTYIGSDRPLRGYSGSDYQDKKEELFRKTSGREIDLANQVDAVVKFLFNALSSEDRNKTTWKRGGDHRQVSPVWRDVSRTMAEFSPSIAAPVTPDGFFYSSMGEPAGERVAMREAKAKAEAFMQGLSDTLNRDRLQHERQAVSPADVAAKNDSRLLAAEQQALSTQAEAETGRKAVEALRAKEAVEKALRKELDDMRASRDAAVVSWHQERENLRLATEAAQVQKEQLEGDKDRLTRDLAAQTRLVNTRDKKLEEAAKDRSELMEELRGALENPGWLSGTLKSTVQAIIDRPASAAKGVKKSEPKE